MKAGLVRGCCNQTRSMSLRKAKEERLWEKKSNSKEKSKLTV